MHHLQKIVRTHLGPHRLKRPRLQIQLQIVIVVGKKTKFRSSVLLENNKRILVEKNRHKQHKLEHNPIQIIKNPTFRSPIQKSKFFPKTIYRPDGGISPPLDCYSQHVLRNGSHILPPTLPPLHPRTGSSRPLPPLLQQLIPMLFHPEPVH